jgi:hypothetical protein
MNDIMIRRSYILPEEVSVAAAALNKKGTILCRSNKNQ